MKKVIELIIGLVIGLVVGLVMLDVLGSMPVTLVGAYAEMVAPPAEVQATGGLQAPEGREAWASVTEARTREALAWWDHVHSYQNEDILGVLYCSTAGDSVPMLKILTLNRTTV